MIRKWRGKHTRPTILLRLHQPIPHPPRVLKIRRAVPNLSRVLLRRDTRVIHEDVNTPLPLALLNLGHQIGDALSGSDVARDTNNLAGVLGAGGGVCLDDGVEGFLAAAGDVDGRAVDGEGLCDHEADAGAAAGYDRDVVLEVV